MTEEISWIKNKEMKHEPYKLGIKDLLAKGASGSRETFKVKAGPNIKMDEENILKSYEGEVRLTLLEEEILAEFQISYTAETICARCLEKFTRKDEVKFEREYQLGKRSAGENELAVGKDFSIEVGEPIEEEITFDIPMKPLCDAKCKGITGK